MFIKVFNVYLGFRANNFNINNITNFFDCFLFFITRIWTSLNQLKLQYIDGILIFSYSRYFIKFKWWKKFMTPNSTVSWLSYHQKKKIKFFYTFTTQFFCTNIQQTSILLKNVFRIIIYQTKWKQFVHVFRTSSSKHNRVKNNE